MNIGQIIDEELAEAKRRIHGRLQSLFIGNGVGRPLSPPGEAKKVVAPQAGKVSKAELAVLTEKALEFVKNNPGCSGADICNAVGVAPEDRNLRVRLLDKVKPKTTRKGTTSKTVYFLRGGAAKSGATSKEGRAALVDELSRVALGFIKKNPGCSSLEVGKALKATHPMSTSDDRYMAYSKLVTSGEARAESTSPMSKRYFPT